MRKSWSAKGFYSKTGALSKSSRMTFLKDASLSGLKIRSLLSADVSNTLTRPVTANSAWATSRSFPAIASATEVEGFSNEDIRKIYLAKCKDLDISFIKDQEQRFFNFCLKSFTNRTIGLNENGLGLESIKVLAGILRKTTNFCRLNLSKNNIEESGAVQLAMVLKKNKSIAVLDISSNNINVEGTSKFFMLLQGNESIVSINISSLEGLHRNRMGTKGAEAVAEFLKTSNVLSHLNISDTSIGKEGFEFLIQGLAHNQALVSLDISNNGLTHLSLDTFCDALVTTNLQELNLSGNKIGNRGCEMLGKMLSAMLANVCPLKKLNISCCDVTGYGMAKIFESLENNPTVIYLNTDGNSLTQFSGTSIGRCLNLNGTILDLSMNNCNLCDECIGKLCEGLGRNISIKKLSLCKNGIGDVGAKSIGDAIAKNSALTTLDLSYNFIKNKGGMEIANALKRNSTIENLLLAENSLKDEAGMLLAEITRFKGNLLKIDLTMNPVNLKYVKEIKENLQKNHMNYKQFLSPKLKREIEKLAIGENDIEGVYLKIQDKRKEKIEYEEKVVKQKSRLDSIILEENEKFQVIRAEFNAVKEKCQVTRVALDYVLYEITKFKFQADKEVNELSDQIAFASQDVRKLEKQSKE